jgi:PH (Pleckstrin Homology) domain-containing protein
MTYPSKVDGWVGAVLALVPAALLLEGIFLRSTLLGTIAFSALIVYALVVFPTNYTIGPDALIVRSGVIRSSIPYQDIRTIRASGSWLSASALSLDRLEIAYGNSRTLISPRDQAGFLRELSTRVPGLQIQSQRTETAQDLQEPR